MTSRTNVWTCEMGHNQSFNTKLAKNPSKSVQTN